MSAPSHSHSKAVRVVFLLFRVSGQSLKGEHGVKLVTFLETLSKETDPDPGERKLIQTEPLKGCSDDPPREGCGLHSGNYPGDGYCEAAMTNSASRVAIYARVSTTNHGQDAGLQTRELRQFAEARGWTITGEYVDTGVSGAKDSRPELNRLMADAKRRRFDIVLVWKLDRFGRSLRHLVNALAEFESLNIAFVSLSDNLDLSTASGRLMFNIIGAMAEFERELIRERVKAGMKNARAKGTRIGRPRVEVDSAQIARLRASGASLRTIAARLGVSVGTVVACSKKLSRSAPIIL